jgi:Tol biopolymer transport system component
MKKHWARGAAIALSILLGVVAIPAAPGWMDDDDTEQGPQYTDWGPPVNLGPVVNTTANEFAPAISKDGRSLYFASNRPGGFGGLDIWVSQRASEDDPWGPPQNLGPTVNSAFADAAPNLSLDGHQLFFHSDRPGGFGGQDIYISRRRNRRDDFGWRTPENLGGGVNTIANEIHAAHFEDDDTGSTTLYFVSDRLGGLGSTDIYASTLEEYREEEIFGPAVLVEELSSAFDDISPTIRRDGREMFIASSRPPNLGVFRDIWVSMRPNTSAPWSEPVHLGSVVNNQFEDAARALSFDGTQLYFNGSQRPGWVGAGDLWVTTRSKLRHRDDDDCDNDARRRWHRSRDHD